MNSNWSFILGLASSQRFNNYDRIDLVAYLKFITRIYNHMTLCNTFWRNMLCRLNTLLQGSLHTYVCVYSYGSSPNNIY